MDEIIGLLNALATINNEISTIFTFINEGGTFTTSSASVSTQPYFFGIPTIAEILPNRFKITTGQDLTQVDVTKLPRLAGLLPAVNLPTGTSVVSVTSLPIPTVVPNQKAVYVNNTGSGILLAGGKGRKSTTVPVGGLFGTDGTTMYSLVQQGTTRTYNPWDFEEELFTLFVTEDELQSGGLFQCNVVINMRMVTTDLKRRTPAMLDIFFETGQIMEVGPSSTTQPPSNLPWGENLAYVQWNPPMLQKTVILSDVALVHKFGITISRQTTTNTDSSGNITGISDNIQAQAMAYDAIMGVASQNSVPKSANFALRVRLGQFDTADNIADPRGFVMFDMQVGEKDVSKTFAQIKT
jgi:hypothetical protein